MSIRDLDFEKYLCKRNYYDILNVFYHLDNMPSDVDDDINESIYQVAQSARKEFLEAIQRLDFPKEDLDKVNQRYNEIISKVEKNGLPAVIDKKFYENLDKKFDKRFEDGTSEISKESFYEWYNYYQKWMNASDEEFEEHMKKSADSSLELEPNEETKLLYTLEMDREFQKIGESIKESIKNFLSTLYSTDYYRKIDKAYLTNTVSEEPDTSELNKWYDYYQKWINESEESFIQKKNELGITDEGSSTRNILELTPTDLLEENIFRAVMATKSLNISFSEDATRKIISYELSLNNPAKDESLTDEIINYWYNYYKTWKYASETKFKIKQATLKIKASILRNPNLKTKAELGIFRDIVSPARFDEAKTKEYVYRIITEEPSMEPNSLDKLDNLFDGLDE